VRTAAGTDPDPGKRMEQTIGAIMGSSANGTGVWALLKSGDMLGVFPRLITVPGYTSQMANSVENVAIGTVGKGYVPGTSYAMTFSGGGISPTIVQATGHAVANANGEIHQVDLVLDSLGAFYTTAPDVVIEAPPAPVPATLTTAIGGGNTLANLFIGTVGGGYVPNEVYDITFAGGGNDPGKVMPTGHATADAHGVIDQAQLLIDSPGANLAVPTATVPAPPSAVPATLTATMSQGANPICVALPAILNQILGHAVVESAGTSEQNDLDWRETLNSTRIIPLSGGVRVLDPITSEIIVRPLAPRVAGVMVRRDFETGAPFHSSANQPIHGIVGPGRTMGFSLMDGGNEGQSLLGDNLGILVRGETGSDFAISSGGFIFIGTDNAGDDPIWQFYNVTRGRDFIHLSLLRSLRPFLGRANITGHTVQAIINTMGFYLRDLQADEHILGYKVDFRRSQNSPEEIRLGHITVAFAAEEPPVLRRITVQSSRYRPAIDAMVAQLERQLNIAA
jgi:phage tail sheath protein FI